MPFTDRGKMSRSYTDPNAWDKNRAIGQGAVAGAIELPNAIIAALLQRMAPESQALKNIKDVQDAWGAQGRDPITGALFQQGQAVGGFADPTNLVDPAAPAMKIGGKLAMPAITIGAKGLQRLGVKADDLIGQYSALWDKMTRAELDDSGASLNMMNFPEAGEKAIDADLGGILNHPRIYQAYPESKTGIKTLTQHSDSGNSGLFAGDIDQGLIAVEGNTGNFKDTTIHEVQHAVQEREGFAMGGSPETVADLVKERERVKVTRELDVIGKADPEVYEAFKEMEHLKENELVKYGAWDKPPELEKRVSELYDILSTSPVAKKLQNAKESVNQLGDARFDAYRHLAGEWEARNAGTRATLQPDSPLLGALLEKKGVKFRAGNPFSTADEIPLDQLIVRGNK